MTDRGIPFHKYTGAGNDFVLVRGDAPALPPPAALARRICPRASGVGVDGLILLAPRGDDRLEVRFFNPDGSEYGTCGNGSRCAARFAVDRGLVPGPELRLVTAAGEVRAMVRGERVALDFEQRVFLDRRISGVELLGEPCDAWLVQIGTPHLVIACPPAAEDRLRRATAAEFVDGCRPLRAHPDLGAQGANVDVVITESSDRLSIRTYERGVEWETLACGSGSMAAVFALHAAGRVGAGVAVVARSGDELTVELLPNDASAARPAGPPAPLSGSPPSASRRQRRRGGESVRLRLTGPARYVFAGVFPPFEASAGSQTAGASREPGTPEDGGGAGAPPGPRA